MYIAIDEDFPELGVLVFKNVTRDDLSQCHSGAIGALCKKIFEDGSYEDVVYLQNFLRNTKCSSFASQALRGLKGKDISKEIRESLMCCAWGVDSKKTIPSSPPRETDENTFTVLHPN